MRLTEKETLKVAELAKLNVSDDIKRYNTELNQIFESIDKFNDIDPDCEIMISPLDEVNKYYKEIKLEKMTKEEIFRNAISNDSEFIVVPKVMK